MESFKACEHLAIIMDGNGRWAAREGVDRQQGHRKGAEVALDIVKHCVTTSVKSVTLYCLSTENMKRPKKEVQFLIHLLNQTLLDNERLFQDEGIRVKVVGDLRFMGEDLNTTVSDIQSKTEHHTKLELNIAFNYSGRWQIQQAVEHVCRCSVASGNSQQFTEFERHIRSDMVSDPDLLIRTSGEHRLSNFMLYHLAYTELVFDNTLWPDFNEQILDKHLRDFCLVDRRFGQVKDSNELVPDVT